MARPKQPRTHAEVIALWPTQAEFARAVGVSPSYARNMVAKDKIPPRLFHAVVEAADRDGYRQKITYARLTEMRRVSKRKER